MSFDRLDPFDGADIFDVPEIDFMDMLDEAAQPARARSEPPPEFKHPGPQWVPAVSATRPQTTAFRQTRGSSESAPFVPRQQLPAVERNRAASETTFPPRQVVSPSFELQPLDGFASRPSGNEGPQGRKSALNFSRLPRRAPVNGEPLRGADAVLGPGVESAMDWMGHHVNELRMGTDVVPEGGEVVQGGDDFMERLPGSGLGNWPPDYVFIGTEEVAVSGSPSEGTPWLWVTMNPPGAQWLSTPRPSPMPDGVQVYHMSRKELHITRFG